MSVTLIMFRCCGFVVRVRDVYSTNYTVAVQQVVQRTNEVMESEPISDSSLLTPVASSSSVYSPLSSSITSSS